MPPCRQAWRRHTSPTLSRTVSQQPPSTRSHNFRGGASTGSACTMTAHMSRLACQLSSCAMLERLPSMDGPIRLSSWTLFWRRFLAGFSNVPACRNLGLVPPVYKRRCSQADTASYRPTAVTEPSKHFYASVISQRLVTFPENRLQRAASQAGFRPHLAVHHQDVAVQHLMNKQVAVGQKLFVLRLSAG